MKFIKPLFILLGFSFYLQAQQTDTLSTERFSIHAQATVIDQYKPGFSARYSGTNSLQTKSESQTSITSSLYIGAKLWKGGSIFINPEIAGGSGLSGAVGIADATNGETFRVGDPAPQIYLARIFYRQLFALTSSTTYQASDMNQLAERVPNKYISLTVGKIGVADYFDDNKYSHDPRTQFMSWGLMDNGAWDYAANTRGYTPSIVLEYVTPTDEIRYGISLVPKEANGNDMNWEVKKASSQALEYTHRYKIKGKDGAIRLLAFYTTTNLGNYEQSIALNPTNPDIDATGTYGNYKYGFTLNAEQDFNRYLGGFFRAGWNNGKTETWMFTEIDRTVSAGLVLNGQLWKRNGDNVGLAYICSGISKEHQDYLAAGGSGFMLGEGNLNYAPEQLAELYYAAELVKNQIYLTGAYQLVVNPGYNADRQGPVNVFSVRLHLNI